MPELRTAEPEPVRPEEPLRTAELPDVEPPRTAVPAAEELRTAEPLLLTDDDVLDADEPADEEPLRTVLPPREEEDSPERTRLPVDEATEELLRTGVAEVLPEETEDERLTELPLLRDDEPASPPDFAEMPVVREGFLLWSDEVALPPSLRVPPIPSPRG